VYSEELPQDNTIQKAIPLPMPGWVDGLFSKIYVCTCRGKSTVHILTAVNV